MPLKPFVISTSQLYPLCYKHSPALRFNFGSKLTTTFLRGCFSRSTLAASFVCLSAGNCRAQTYFSQQQQKQQQLKLLQHRSFLHSVTNMKMTQVNGERIIGISSSSAAGGSVKAHNESLRDICRSMNGKVKMFLDKKTTDNRLKEAQEQTRISLDVIRKTLEDFRLNELALSFNGGKDCLVLLILYLSVLHDFFEVPTPTTTAAAATTNGSASPPLQQQQQTTKPRRPSYSTASPHPQRLNTVYVTCAHPFREVDDFVDECVDTYHLDLVRYSGVSIKTAFETYLHDNPTVKTIFVGTRRTDPHGALLKHFDPTDHGWPEFLRVHPVIDWHYADVWTFLRAIEVPYCCLYDQGYTSLGGKTDTHPNPALSASNAEGGTSKFRPAYELIADEEERLGRD